jgi:hypothetical protein
MAGAATAFAGLAPVVIPGPAAASSTFTPLRPPATPLAVRSMYLSTWLAGDSLVGRWPTFWNGEVTGLAGIVRVDETPYLFAGAPSAPAIRSMTQLSLTVTATGSTFVLGGGGIELTVNFLSPVDPADLQRQCVPMSYLTVQAACTDGADHRVGVYLDISGEWAHGDRTQQITWTQQPVGSQVALTCTPATPTVLAEVNDQASWGTMVFAADAEPGLTWQIADAASTRAAGAAGPLPDSVAPGPQPIDRWPVLAFSRDLGVVSGQTPSTPMILTIGHVRTPAVSYLGADLDPWWRAYWPDWTAMLSWFRADYPTALSRSSATDARITADAARVFHSDKAAGQQYGAICALALRQAFAGTELVNQDGKPWALLKEISSDGNVSTVDVLYPALPVWRYLSPGYLRLLLEPVLGYVEAPPAPPPPATVSPTAAATTPLAGRWSQPFAPHDLGAHYPNATGHNDGGGENMPVEESANMLIMSAALLSGLDAADTAGYVKAHYSTLRGWAEYLVGNALDPGFQNQTDDFTGFIAHSSNLALKGIVGIGAMSVIAHAAGRTADRARYHGIATNYIGQWVGKSMDSAHQHLKLAYDQNGTWSLKYNGYADRLLGLDLIPDNVVDLESAWYAGHANTFGVELDPRHSYTKTDWEFWTAGFLGDAADIRTLLVRSVYRFANETGGRVPFTDWYDTITGNRQGFAARPVIGGVFSLLALLPPPASNA